jgi:hypothetical protein
MVIFRNPTENRNLFSISFDHTIQRAGLAGFEFFMAFTILYILHKIIQLIPIYLGQILFYWIISINFGMPMTTTPRKEATLLIPRYTLIGQ